MSYPLLMLVGQAGSGKDTVAGMIAEKVPDTELVSLASPIKEFAGKFMGFSDTQLYGPSSARAQLIPAEETLAALKMAATPFADGYGDSSIRNGVTDWLGRYFPASDRHQVRVRLREWLATLPQDEYSARTVLQTLGTAFGRAIDPDVWVKAAISTAQQKLVSGAGLVVITDGRFRNEILAVRRQNGMVWNLVVDGTGIFPSAPTMQHQSETEQTKIPSSWFDQTILNSKKGLDRLDRLVTNALESSL